MVNGTAHRVIICLALMILNCDFPYAPAPEPGIGSVKNNKVDTGTIGSGYLYSVNIGQQVCNPSVTRSPAYPSCMLWLGFTKMTVKIPDNMTGFDTMSIAMHDRLTILDTGNTVRWFLMRSAIDTKGELQCPEWSTHPDYIACLVGTINQPFSGWAVRLSDKQALKFCNRGLEEFSTPHLWLPDTAHSSSSVASSVTYDNNGLADKEFIFQFFGTKKVKFVYSLASKGGNIYLADYSVDSVVVPISLEKPSGKEGEQCASPLISPDGNWVAYHCYSNSAQGTQYSSYIQRLKPGSKPILIAEGASDPHWWVDIYNDNTYYIICTVTDGAYYCEYDFSDPSIESTGSAGSTLKIKLKGTYADVPEHVGALEVDEAAPDTLVRLPFKGGLSRDGYFLCTAYKFAYIMKLQ
jgi:hypothetical protein